MTRRTKTRYKELDLKTEKMKQNKTIDELKSKSQRQQHNNITEQRNETKQKTESKESTSTKTKDR